MTKGFTQQLSLRFTSWSRKSYAAFKSVGRHVTIGNLKNIVADALLGKQKNVLPIFTVAREMNAESNEEEQFDPPEEDRQTLFLLQSILKIKITACENLNDVPAEQFYSWLKAVYYKRFQPFLYPIFIPAGYAKRNARGMFCNCQNYSYRCDIRKGFEAKIFKYKI